MTLDMSSDNMYNLFMNIKNVIEKLGTREEAAKTLGVSLRTIYRWYTLKAKPSKLALATIIKVVDSR